MPGRPIIWNHPPMAELVLGGIEVAIRPLTRPGQCAHPTSLSVIAAGIERRICETCGHLSISFVSEVSGPVTRSHFARPADELPPEVEVVFYPFSDVEGLGVRRRSRVNPVALLI